MAADHRCGKRDALMREHTLTVRQSYARQDPRLAQQIGRLAHAQQFKRMRHQLRKQRTWLGRLTRELERLLDQVRNPPAKIKLYSLHKPAVDCTSKYKARKHYEFGTTVGVVCTQTEKFVIGMRSYPGNPYGGYTLDDLIQKAETIVWAEAKTVVLDLRYCARHATKSKVIHRGRKLSTSLKVGDCAAARPWRRSSGT